MTVTVLLEVQAKPENIEKLRLIFSEILVDTRNYQGCIDVKVLGDQDDPLNLVLVEKWQSRQHYQNYFAWRTETGALEILAALLCKEPSIRYFHNENI